MSRDRYESPLSGRYASKEMLYLQSPDYKFLYWRKLWFELASAERSLGIKEISEAALAEMQANFFMTEKDYTVVAEIEKRNRHDVMANVQRYGQLCPSAAGIIHLGATSCYVTDNTDLIIIRDSLQIVELRLARVINRFVPFMQKWRATPALGFTHYQPAQLVTPGKRAAMWVQDLVIHLGELRRIRQWLPFRGVKGTTGTQDSFLDLFGGDGDKVKQLDQMVTTAFGFERSLPITGQSYTRLIDSMVLSAIALMAASLHKICLDLRLLAHDKEIEEPFEAGQIGSSAMAYKRNPMRLERNCALDRHPVSLLIAGISTQMTQMLERTLDDSAIRRIYLAEAFLAADAILLIMQNVAEGLVVYPKMIERNVRRELPFMATEHVITAMVKAGVNRQETHERIRVHAQAAGKTVKEEGKDNDLVDRLKGDAFFQPVHASLDAILEPSNFIGRAPEQVDEFITQHVIPVLLPYQEQLVGKSQLKV